MDLIFPQSGRLPTSVAVAIPGHYFKRSSPRNSKKKKRVGSAKRSLVTALKAQSYTQPPMDCPTFMKNGGKGLLKKHSGGTAHDTHSGVSEETPATRTINLATSMTAAAPDTPPISKPTCNSITAQEETRKDQQQSHDHRTETTGSIHENHLTTITSIRSLQAEYYYILPDDAASELTRKTESRVDVTIAKSPFLRDHQQVLEHVPNFTMDEDFCRTELLGEGGFASVYEINVLGPERIDGHTPNQKYVVKHLSASLGDKKAAGVGRYKKLHLGAKDMMIESHLLAALDHPNILKLKGCSFGGAASFAELKRTDACFMILPKLSSTLADMMSIWKRRKPNDPPCYAHTAGVGCCSLPALESTTVDANTVDHRNDRSSGWIARRRQRREIKEKHRKQERTFFCDRLQIIVDLLKALEYLHARHIMHRDIKPANIGFDQHGCLKLFDLGLAKEIPAGADYYYGESNPRSAQVSKVYPDFTTRYLCLGNTGTPRQMAPEVIRRDPYNCKVDVFGTSIVAWELLMLQKPYGPDMSGDFVKECVAIYGDRPSPLPCKWSHALRKLIQEGWTQSVKSRPSARQMRIRLEAIVTLEQK